MIRYVDSAGWTWEVCELADRRAPDPLHADAAPVARPAAAARADLADVRAPLADVPLADASVDASGELYFFSRVGARKLRGYPATWTQLSRTGLEALCDRAQELGARRAS